MVNDDELEYTYDYWNPPYKRPVDICVHDWPAEITVGAECWKCGLRYGEWISES